MRAQYNDRILPLIRMADHGPEVRTIAGKLAFRGFEVITGRRRDRTGPVPVIDLHLYGETRWRLQCPAESRSSLRIAVLPDGQERRTHDLEADALAKGFDDVVSAGASSLRLAARLVAVSRRRSLLIEISEMAQTCDILWQGKRLDLPALLRRVLILLWRQRGTIISRDSLINACWRDPDSPMDRTVDATIKRLRKALRRIGVPDELIVTRNRVGYGLDCELAADSLEFIPNHRPIDF